MESYGQNLARARSEALLLISNEKALSSSDSHYPPAFKSAVLESRSRLAAVGLDWAGGPIEARYQKVSEIQREVARDTGIPGETVSDKLDRVLTHKVWGTFVFLGLMALMFQSIFTFARLPMEALQAGVGWLGGAVGYILPPGDLNSLLVDGVIAGVGAVVVFLPQILMLFLFIGFLEDTGYMARAAFLMDRIMSKVGLHGKSFIPMLSSFACAIPGIMATRTIESPKDRLVTILIAPLMSCSARLPVYTLLIAACIPDIKVFGILKLTGLVMLGMYVLGVSVALVMAWIFKKTLLKGEAPLLILELPPVQTSPGSGGVAPYVGSLPHVSSPSGHDNTGDKHPDVVSGHLSPEPGASQRLRRATRRGCSRSSTRTSLRWPGGTVSRAHRANRQS